MRRSFFPKSFFLPGPFFYLLTPIFYLLGPIFYLLTPIPSNAEIIASGNSGGPPKFLLEKSGKVIFNPEKSGLDDNFPLGVQTCEDGQIKMVFQSYLEIRAKENSVLSLQKPDEFKVSSGLAGFKKLPGRQIIVSTPHCLVESTDGIFVLRVYRTMTRLAVLKGSVKLTRNNSETRTILAKQEVSACNNEVSDIYKTLDDLYFAWYWDPPSKKSP